MLRRVIFLLLGLVLYGIGCGLMIEAALGLDPWTVFAQGLSLLTGVPIGWLTNIIGLGILLLWIPLRQRPGWGTLANIALVGTSMQILLDLLPPVDALWARIPLFGVGVLVVALGSGLYLGARFGPGPRDGLMTGLSARTGMPIWGARTAVEVTVLSTGWLLGGDVGVGTVVFAVSIGPLVQMSLRRFDTASTTAPATTPTRPSTAAVSAPGTRDAPTPA